MNKIVIGNNTAEQVINHNPYLFYGPGLPENHPKRKLNKKIWMVYRTLEGHKDPDIYYITTKSNAIKFMNRVKEIDKRINAPVV